MGDIDRITVFAADLGDCLMNSEPTDWRSGDAIASEPPQVRVPRTQTSAWVLQGPMAASLIAATRSWYSPSERPMIVV